MPRYGKTFHQHRRMFHENFNKTIVAKFQPIQTREARLLVQNLCEHPEDREKYLSRFAVSIITRIGFGHHVDAEDDPYVALAVETSETLAKAGSGGGMLIEIFPFRTKYVQYAKHQAPRVRELYDFPFREVQAQTARGSAGASIMASQLEAHSREGDDIGYSLLDIKGMGATMYVAGVDTTSSSLSIFILAMTLYPECQARAQEELDAVVGTDRLPDFNDRGSLPYLEGIIRETLRWHHPIPSGAPHRVMEDDVYDGMFVPKGSMVIANIRGMTWDESLYSDPFGFDPARYARGEPPPAATWGFGRRKCPGRHLADASLWIAMATILSTLSITKAVDTDGNSITPETKFETSLTRSKKILLPLPPGPPTDPLIGHLRLIPLTDHHLFFHELSKSYGDVVHLDVLGRSMIVLNSTEAAEDLMETRSANYSDRPFFRVLQQFVVVLHLSGTFLLRLQQHFNKTTAAGYRPFQIAEARILAQTLSEDPEDKEGVLTRFSTAVIMQIAYGHRVTSIEDRYVKLAEEVGAAVALTGSAGGTLVDFFPILQYLPSWFPGTYYLNFAREWAPKVQQMHDLPVQAVQAQLEEGIAKQSIVGSQLDALLHNEAGAHKIEDIKALSVFLLAMVLYPEYQAAAQAEIDAVIGSQRLPEFDDRETLPLLNCIVQETLRWHTPLPTGIPHRAMEDDVYNGMFIPGGSITISNIRYNSP
ncbi:hypothetical protein DXG01_001328 [Tephrocybe rancida]|nr:hypothetical protein DXG01_001328 [Tephrocybe rancida]